MADAWLSLGANIGDRRATIDAAVERLGALPGTSLTARSSYYRTEPVGPVAQDWFVNIAVAVRTDLNTAALRTACREIEAGLGRDRSSEIPWGPRSIDIDVIAASDRPRAKPHRELTRGYVIVPLAEIAPGLTIAGRTLAAYLADADTAGVEKLDW
jgi:2-amino-4-hydroxy-6-hydroxymethyldihydropteridine diphosphokinase